MRPFECFVLYYTYSEPDRALNMYSITQMREIEKDGTMNE